MHAFYDRLISLDKFFEPLQPTISVSEALDDLLMSPLLTELFNNAQGIEGFEKARFDDISAFSLYRSLLYITVRMLQPKLMIETGTLHGFSSAFILQAMQHNHEGRLVSIDLPSRDLELISQGTMKLPGNFDPGWSIPKHLRERLELRLGRAEQLLPEAFKEETPDIFLHDSDHSYTHIMMEMSLAWALMEKGLIIVDNIELNEAFDNFSKGSDGRSTVYASYDNSERQWKHGFLIR